MKQSENLLHRMSKNTYIQGRLLLVKLVKQDKLGGHLPL